VNISALENASPGFAAEIPELSSIGDAWMLPGIKSGLVTSSRCLSAEKTCKDAGACVTVSLPHKQETQQHAGSFWAQ
jgi:hypothetical protein